MRCALDSTQGNNGTGVAQHEHARARTRKRPSRIHRGIRCGTAGKHTELASRPLARYEQIDGTEVVDISLRCQVNYNIALDVDVLMGHLSKCPPTVAS